MSERRKLLLLLAVFAACWWLPVDSPRFMGALDESLRLVRWYAHEHVLLCLVPAFFIAGAISAFVSQGAVTRYLGAQAPKWLAYLVASASGTLLAVCSCTVLPLFASIHRRGAGLGPATAFLYSGPAINLLAIILTAQVLGFELGLARGIAAVLVAVLIGLAMQWIFRRDEAARGEAAGLVAPALEATRRPWQDAAFFAAMVGVLVFANWAPPAGQGGIWAAVHGARWWLSGFFLIGVLLAAWRWFSGDERREWLDASWFFVKQITPLLLAGVAVAGLLLGGPGGGQGLIPASWVQRLVGGNGLGATAFAAVAGAFMYFATLTEVPILEGLLAAGMGKGPALALLLAGPALSLPNMLVIRGVLGNRKTAVYVVLVVLFSTLAGLAYGALLG